MKVSIVIEYGASEAAIIQARKFKRRLECCIYQSREAFQIQEEMRNTRYLSNSRLGFNDDAIIFVETAINLASKKGMRAAANLLYK